MHTPKKKGQISEKLKRELMDDEESPREDLFDEIIEEVEKIEEEKGVAKTKKGK